MSFTVHHRHLAQMKKVVVRSAGTKSALTAHCEQLCTMLQDKRYDTLRKLLSTRLQRGNRVRVAAAKRRLAGASQAGGKQNGYALACMALAAKESASAGARNSVLPVLLQRIRNKFFQHATPSRKGKKAGDTGPNVLDDFHHLTQRAEITIQEHAARCTTERPADEPSSPEVEQRADTSDDELDDEARLKQVLAMPTRSLGLTSVGAAPGSTGLTLPGTLLRLRDRLQMLGSKVGQGVPLAPDKKKSVEAHRVRVSGGCHLGSPVPYRKKNSPSASLVSSGSTTSSATSSTAWLDNYDISQHFEKAEVGSTPLVGICDPCNTNGGSSSDSSTKAETPIVAAESEASVDDVSPNTTKFRRLTSTNTLRNSVPSRLEGEDEAADGRMCSDVCGHGGPERPDEAVVLQRRKRLVNFEVNQQSNTVGDTANTGDLPVVAHILTEASATSPSTSPTTTPPPCFKATMQLNGL